MKLARGRVAARVEIRLMLFALMAAAAGAGPAATRDPANNGNCNITQWDTHESVVGVCPCATSAECSTCDPSTHTILLATGGRETVVLPALIANFPRLININITGATVVFEQNDTFKSTLKNLNVFCGSVSSLGPRALSWASELITLRIVRCGLRTLYPESLSGLVSLRDIDLSNNNITQLPVVLLRPLISINRVVLDNNSIQELPDKVFATRQNCEISLNSNNISNIAGQAFMGRKVERLWLAHNQLRDLWMVNNALSEVDAREVSLEGNFLERIPHAFFRMRKLQKVTLSWNKITSLQSGDLICLVNKATLDLRHNQISEVTLPGECLASQLWLDENPLLCDGRALPLYDRLRAEDGAGDGPGRPRCRDPPALRGRLLADLSPRDFVDSSSCPPCWCARRPALHETEVLCETSPPALPALPPAGAADRVTLRLSRPPPADGPLAVPPEAAALSLAGLELAALPPLPAVDVSLAGARLACSCALLARLRDLGGRLLDAELATCSSGRTPREEETALRCGSAGDAGDAGDAFALVWVAAAALAVAGAAVACAATRQPGAWRAVAGRRAPRGPGPPPRYEVFLSSESGDAAWVAREVLPRFERELGPRLCVAARAYEPGELVAAQAARLAAQAGVVVALVTPRYLASGAARLELAAGAARGPLVAVLAGLGRARVPLPAGTVTLRWGSPLFWRRLWALVPASPPAPPLAAPPAPLTNKSLLI